MGPGLVFFVPLPLVLCPNYFSENISNYSLRSIP